MIASVRRSEAAISWPVTEQKVHRSLQRWFIAGPQSIEKGFKNMAANAVRKRYGDDGQYQ